MATRNNALSEITRFWLQECHGLFIRESIPVKVKRNSSDIDFAVTTPFPSVTLLDRITFKNAIIETKDERDFDPKGKDFLKRLKSDMHIMKDKFIAEDSNCYFYMLKEQHHNKAKEIFNTENFAKIFIFHNINITDNEIESKLAKKDIYIVKSIDILNDILVFFKNKYKGAGIRNSLIGDIFDMLIRYHNWGQLKLDNEKQKASIPSLCYQETQRKSSCDINDNCDIGVIGFGGCGANFINDFLNEVGARVKLGFFGEEFEHDRAKADKANFYYFNEIDAMARDFSKVKLCFIVGGLGGFSCAHIGDFAKKLREMGIMVAAMQVFPFSFEGERRQNKAEMILDNLPYEANAVLVFYNDEYIKNTGKKRF